MTDDDIGRASETLVMSVLLDDPRPLSRAEVATAIGDRIKAEDGIEALKRSGLAHEHAGFVWATRAALARGQLPA